MSEIKDETQINLNFTPGRPKVSDVSRSTHVKGDLRFSMEKVTHTNEEMEKIIWKLITHFEENY